MVTPQALTYPRSGVSTVDALVEDLDSRWNAGGPLGMPVTVTYSFMDAVPSYYTSGEITGFRVFNEAMEVAARSALAKYAAVADITFVEVSDAGAGGQIRFGSAQIEGTTAAYAYFPTTHEVGGDVWIDWESDNNTSPTEGSYAYLTFLHEIGHALGLKHPGDYGGGTDAWPYLPASLDNTDQTVMSYITGSVHYPSVLGPLDIQAIEYLYGPKTAKTIGNLQAGSEAAESLTGTAGTDSLLGRGGNDVLVGGGGNDGIMGGTGDDWVQGDGGADTLYGNQGQDTLFGGDGVDTVFGGQGDDWVDGGGSNDLLYANMGSDLVVAGDGADTVFGGQGDDIIYGGSGADAVFGNRGNDTLVGGTGNDFFYAGHDGGQDVISDFDRLGDWLIIPTHVNGTDITTVADVLARARDVDGGVLIDLGAGNTVTLIGLTSATLSPYDIWIQ